VGFLNGLTRERFVQISLELFRQNGLHLPAEEATVFYDVFDAIDLYRDASLTFAELAGGLCSFFGGTIDQKTDAVFDILEMMSRCGGQSVAYKSALHEFLKPFVWCMVPHKAQILRPILLPHVTEDIFADISMSSVNCVSRQEMKRWLHKGHFMQRRTSPDQQMLSVTIAEHAAASIDMAVRIAWERYETTQKLRTYGQQTWQEERGRPQYITDVGAYRYASQQAPHVMSKAYVAASSSASVFSSIAESSNQLLKAAQMWLAEDEEDVEDVELSPAVSKSAPSSLIESNLLTMAPVSRVEPAAAGVDLPPAGKSVPQVNSVGPSMQPRLYRANPLSQNMSFAAPASVASKSMSRSASGYTMPSATPGQMPTLLGRH
jgi:hypothetical protein